MINAAPVTEMVPVATQVENVVVQETTNLEYESSISEMDLGILSNNDSDGLDVAPEFKEPEPVKGMNING
jgi:hypothetical protein